MTEKKEYKTYEEKIKRISEIVEILESNEIPLEKNIELVKQGATLTKECKNYLDKAELTITKIINDKEENFE